jgi:hypothetical protein
MSVTTFPDLPLCSASTAGNYWCKIVLTDPYEAHPEMFGVDWHRHTANLADPTRREACPGHPHQGAGVHRRGGVCPI